MAFCEGNPKELSPCSEAAVLVDNLASKTRSTTRSGRRRLVQAPFRRRSQRISSVAISALHSPCSSTGSNEGKIMADRGDIYNHNSSEYSSDDNELYCHAFMVVMIWATRKINRMERRAMMQSEYRLFNKLLNSETDLSWDRFAQKPSFDKERWAAFLKINPEYNAKKGLQNYDMYGPIFDQSNATGSMAFASGGTQPTCNADSNADDFLDELRTFSGPLSGKKRRMSGDDRPSKDKMMKGKMQMWPDEILDMARNANESAQASKAAKESRMKKKEVGSDGNDPYSMDAIQDIIEALDLDIEIKIKAFMYLFYRPKMWRQFCRMTPKFRWSWILSIPD